MAIGGLGFDNGTNLTQCSHSIQLTPDLLYRFRVTAVNGGGESFPSEELAVVWHGPLAKNVLVINGFQRLAGPQVVQEDSTKGFDMDSDPGVSYGLTAGWCGNQTDFDVNSPTFGNSGSEMEGCIMAGNTFNYTTEHVTAISSAYLYNVTSVTRSVVEQGSIDLASYDAIDLILGNERSDLYSLKQYKTFTPSLRMQLKNYLGQPYGSISGRHSLLVSGSYVASDMLEDDERAFISDYLHISLLGAVAGSNSVVHGLQQDVTVTNTLNPDHYATTRSDVLNPQGNGFVAMQYSCGRTAAVACRGNVPTFVMGFPFECITNSAQRAYTMRGIMSFLIGE
jgi:hypothetical protein